MTLKAPRAETDAIDRRLLNEFQRDFPLTPAPYRSIGDKLGIGEDEVMGRLLRLRNHGMVSRVGPVIRPHSIGTSTLAALAVPAEQLDAVAMLVNGYPEVNHNYQREHRFNLWFVATAADETRLQAVLDEIERRTGCPLIRLPMLEDYHIDLGFDLDKHGRSTDVPTRPHLDRDHPETVRANIDETDRSLIAAVQQGLPMLSRPYATLGIQVGLDEATVIARLVALLDKGVFKRLGVVVRHHELGFRANAMVVWDVDEAQIAALGRCMGRFEFITLCYRRPRRLPEWRYNLFCMIHGRDREEVQAHLGTLISQCGIGAIAHEVLFSVRRFKQRGAVYS